MTFQFSDIAARAAADGRISAEDVFDLRRSAWAEGSISDDEAEAIFAANRAVTDPTPEWCDFFVEAIGEYTVMQREPRGYVSQANADWLVSQIDRDGRLESMCECELLVRVFERASNVPQSLKDYAVAQIERAVLQGEGPTRDGGRLEKGNINATEVRLLRRAIFAPASERPAAVGRHEAELLFRLKDATLGANNAPEWKALFVQGVANYLTGFAAPNAQLARERAAELQAFVNDNRAGVGRFFGQMATSAPNVFGTVFGRKGTGASREELLAEATAVTTGEGSWLDAHIQADGKVDELEQALLDFLAEETGA